MPRKRLETRRSRIAKMLISDYQSQNTQDIQEALKDLLDNTIEYLNRQLRKVIKDKTILPNDYALQKVCI